MNEPDQPCKAEDENEKYNLPCPYNPKVKCVQYPEEECGCDPCGECEIKLKASEELARKFHETYERLAPDFGYKTRKASAKPWGNVPEDNKKLMIAVCKEILQPYSVYKLELAQPCKAGEFVKRLREKYGVVGISPIAAGYAAKQDIPKLCDIIARFGREKDHAEQNHKYFSDRCHQLVNGNKDLQAALADKEAEIEKLRNLLVWLNSSPKQTEILNHCKYAEWRKAVDGGLKQDFGYWLTEQALQ